MIKGMLSVVLPDRNGQPYLQKTIDGLLANAEGQIEVIVVCDGVWPDPAVKNDPRVIVIHHGAVHNSVGMRDSINRGFAVARGEFVMKLDEHCMVPKGFDTALKADCEDDWVVIPRRYRLDADEWRLEEYKILEDGSIVPDTENYKHIRPPVDYMFISYPYERPFDKTCGLHGAEDRERQRARADLLIDDTMTSQGSCYFLKKAYWDKLFPEGLVADFYGQFTQESQEISNKVWLSGGREIVNKKTWYAHMHKGKRGKGYGFSNEQYRQHMIGTEKGRVFCIDYWMNNKHLTDPKETLMIHPFEWLLEKFWPVPTWPEDWKTRIIEDAKKDYSTLRAEKGEII